MEHSVLGQELIERVKEDQSASFKGDLKIFSEITKKNAKWLNGIIDKYGWPTVSKVGKDASEAAWLLVQHSDYDVDFQKKCLELMKKEMEKGEVSRHNVASLEDRIRMNMKLPQIYGTQITGDLGDEYPYNLEDEANVDARRKAMGLIPLKDYIEFIRKANKRLKEARQNPEAFCPCGSGKQFKKCHGR